MDRFYAAIDLKSFYASVECVERKLDPLKTNLVVADAERSEKTICLAVSPSMKAIGIPGRPRLFEVIRQVEAVNAQRLSRAPGNRLQGGSSNADDLRDTTLRLDYIIARPRMSLYMEYSTRIYSIYTRRISPEDIHVYSIDEVFIDLTPYLKVSGLSPRALTMQLILDVFRETGITATAGIGTNLYLAKVAMDIEAKHIDPDENGVRIAELDEHAYRKKLWEHKPLTDFWRIGKGIARKLEGKRIFTMGDVAEISVSDEDVLYDMFGVNAELLIDHAWGWEPCTIADIKAYKPDENSLSEGQILPHGYDKEKAALIVREMADKLAMNLVSKHLTTDRIFLMINYDRANADYDGEMQTDYYGRMMPKGVHGNVRLMRSTASARKIVESTIKLYNELVDEKLLVRRINIGANHVIADASDREDDTCCQLDIFSVPGYCDQQTREDEKEEKRQRAVVGIREKYGSNAILKGMNLLDGATSIERNNMIGGHKA